MPAGFLYDKLFYQHKIEYPAFRLPIVCLTNIRTDFDEIRAMVQNLYAENIKLSPENFLFNYRFNYTKK